MTTSTSNFLGGGGGSNTARSFGKTSEPNDGLGQTFGRPSRDDFTSTGGSYIKLGNHKSTRSSSSIRAYDPTFLAHSPIKDSGAAAMTAYSATDTTTRMKLSCASHAETNYQGSLNQTKFHAGFQRKGKRDIVNPAADEVRMRKQESEYRGALANDNRAITLYKTNNKNGFDVITGAPKPNVTPIPESFGGKRRIIPVISDEIAANSRIMLRESGNGRFFMPHATGIKHEYRQEILQKQGSTKQFTSSILAPGNRDLPSFGIEDNFSQSQYPGSQPEQPGYVRLDLPTMREPGKYTPRKQHMNPSGDANLVKSWGSGMDISNKALRCEV